MSETLSFHDEAALIDRLSTGLQRRPKEVIFLVGAPLSEPSRIDMPGVPGVEGIIDLIRSEFQDDASQLAALTKELGNAKDKRYQAAFMFLQGRRGQAAANEIVRNAVLAARKPNSADLLLNETEFDIGPVLDDACRNLEFDTSGWALSEGTEALGNLIAHYPVRFGQSLLTTNFDPLVEVSINRAGGRYYRTMLHSDGNLAQTQGTGCHVIHLHGYWYGSDTLHTTTQLAQPRPKLKASLAALLRSKLMVICAYGGWDDSFTETLIEVVRDDTAYPEILWTFYSRNPSLSESLISRLQPGVDRGRVALYSGIDCHHFFTTLYERWLNLETPALHGSATPSVLQAGQESRECVEQKSTIASPLVLEGEEEDRPPLIEICVGRDNELSKVKTSDARVVFITGLGGEGKSTLVARYFNDGQQDHKFEIFIWRDCKEESERFESQLASVIAKLSGGRVSARQLANQSVAYTIQILIDFMQTRAILFVFDNADHYVDLEAERMTGAADMLVTAMLKCTTPSQVVFTCRPSIEYDHPLVLSQRLQGISLDAALMLFAERGAPSGVQEIEEAHQLTRGHAFWLDLLAVQVAKRSHAMDLSALVRQIRFGRGPMPVNTLNSIWSTLKEREQFVLRTMAETVKPITEAELGDYLHHQISYNKLVKGLQALRTLNLIVVKRRQNEPDFLELHPMVRQFVQTKFSSTERTTVINAIIKVYKRIIGSHKSELAEGPPLATLQYWSQIAELDIAAGRLNDAFSTLAEASNAFLASHSVREFCRVARILFSAGDWVSNHHRYKAFEETFKAFSRSLSYLGDFAEAERLLDKYEKTVPEKSARYINYCEMRCYSYWVRGDFVTAIEWGEKGRQLKLTSGVDTSYDVAHSLALARRDAGDPESALSVFLDGGILSEITDPEEFDEEQDPAFYGNIGRCLHFMGQIDSALVCYQKSALLLERGPTYEHVLNQGFIRAWIGELLAAREEFKLAYAFLRAAYLKWEHLAPPRAGRISIQALQAQQRCGGATPMGDGDVEHVCREWILRRRTRVAAV